MAREDSSPTLKALGERLFATRKLTLDLATPLSDADATIQPFPDASPAKWHLAHTTWFFETFVLRDHVLGYSPFDERYAFLFNSYYEAEGPRHARPRRGMLSRPSLDDIRAYRAHVDESLERALPHLSNEALDLIELGINHEQQHEELFLTDILATLAENPLEPAYGELPPSACFAVEPLSWHRGRQGVVEIGAPDSGFAFDCERPRHSVFLAPHEIAGRRVTNKEWREFMGDGGYRTSTLWLSEGWDWVQRESVTAPLYWQGSDENNGYKHYTLAGLRDLPLDAPVCHISWYEASAFAEWKGMRLPTEFEWEAANAKFAWGSRWEWTGSAYLPYPGFRKPAGAVGEYNGKFMINQMVLRGASVATPEGHSRPTYRNFFHPHLRWQFTGLRLCR